METVPLAEAKTDLSRIVALVAGTHQRVTITRNGRPIAVLVSPDDLEQLETTIEVLGDPETMRRLRQAEEEIARGEVVGAEQVDAMLRARRPSA
jgi:antitoxin YefM